MAHAERRNQSHRVDVERRYEKFFVQLRLYLQSKQCECGLSFRRFGRCDEREKTVVYELRFFRLFEFDPVAASQVRSLFVPRVERKKWKRRRAAHPRNRSGDHRKKKCRQNLRRIRAVDCDGAPCRGFRNTSRRAQRRHARFGRYGIRRPRNASFSFDEQQGTSSRRLYCDKRRRLRIYAVCRLRTLARLFRFQYGRRIRRARPRCDSHLYFFRPRHLPAGRYGKARSHRQSGGLGEKPCGNSSRLRRHGSERHRDSR